jgi:hypothetical protein
MSDGTKYCGSCGATLPESGRCRVCGHLVPAAASFCPSCGNHVFTSNDDNDYPSVVVTALENLAAPSGLIILWSGPDKRPKRMELRVGPDGEIPSEQHRALIELLQEDLVREGYLVADIQIDGAEGTCVWHVVNGGVYGLSADHGLSVLLYNEAIWPTFSEEDASDLVDAPSLEGGRIDGEPVDGKDVITET